MIHQARNYDATCVIVSGLANHALMPELALSQAAQYETPGPQL